MNQSHKRPALNYILEVTITAYLQVGGVMRLRTQLRFTSIDKAYCVLSTLLIKVKPAELEPPLNTFDMIKRTCLQQKISKSWRLLIRIRPENRPKGIKLRFECDHIAPSGFGAAYQEGTDSYVLFRSNMTYV